jgi:hypothetical protein
MRQAYGPWERTEDLREQAQRVRTSRDARQEEVDGLLNPPLGPSASRMLSANRMPFGRAGEDTVPSDSMPGVYYRLWRRPDGTWACDCPDSRFRGNACKHARRKEKEERTGWR